MTDAQLPVGLDWDHHHHLEGRQRHVWLRRVALLVVAAVPILGLLNIFGQRAAVTTADSAAASLSADSPARVRGGLIFTTKLVITAHGQLNDARLFLARGWFQGMTYNAIAPQPSTQESTGDWVIFDFGRIPARQSVPIWISWQTNPTNVGRHTADLRLYDGSTHVLTLHRTITIFP